MSIELTDIEKLHLCIQALARCYYRIEYDKQCGYGERSSDNRIDVIETLLAIEPKLIKEIKDKVKHDLFNGVDTNAGRSADN